MAMRRLVLAAAAAAVVSGFAAASAAASPPPPPLFGVRGLPALEMGTAAPARAASLTLQTDPVKFEIHGFSYRMVLTAHKTIGQPATVDVALSRTGIGTYNIQTYDYQLKAGEVGFTGSLSKLATAHLSSGASAEPSALDLTYTSAGYTAPGRCTMPDGSTKTFTQESGGFLSISSIGIATGSSFFGTLKVKPRTATLSYDPGCRSDNGQLFTLCEGPALLKTVAPDGTGIFATDLHGTTKAYEIATNTAGISSSVSVSREVGTLNHVDDILPNPSFTASGATAVLDTAGSMFLRGMAKFTSADGPAVGKPHTCYDLKDLRRRTYVFHVYRGTLVPGGVSPLRAIFDTGAIPLIAVPAQLDQVVYSN